MIADKLTAESDAGDLEKPAFGKCWQRSFYPMPRLRIATETAERMIPWYSILEVHVDTTFRIFELYLAEETVCTVVSKKPQPGLYANLQLERVKMISPVAGVTIRFEDLRGK